MKYLPILLFTLPLWSMHGQSVYSFSDDFDWSTVEKRKESIIQEFIKTLPDDELDYYTTSEELSAVLHTVDLNNDRLEDILFEGPLSEEEAAVIVYLNEGKSFHKALTKEQYILHLEFSNGYLSKLVTKDTGCCGEIIVRDQFYDISWKGGKELRTKLSKSFEYFNETLLPEHCWPQSKSVRVLRDKAKLRYEPVIDDSTSHDYDEGTGNVVGVLLQGTTALALAEATDSTGRVWFFVAIDPEFTLTSTLFYEPKEGFRSYKCGWISSHFVEEIK